MKGENPTSVPRIIPTLIKIIIPIKICKVYTIIITTDINNSPISSYIYIRVNTKLNLNGSVVEVYIDSGTGRTLIGRKFLKTLEYTIKVRDTEVKGVGGKLVRISEWATFKIYFESFDKSGNLILIKFIKGV